MMNIFLWRFGRCVFFLLILITPALCDDDVKERRPGARPGEERYIEPPPRAPASVPLATNREHELGKYAKDAVPKLRQALSDPSLDVRRDAAEALMKLGKHANDAVPELRLALLDPDYRVQRHASWALHNLGIDEESAVRELRLIEALPDSDPGVRSDAADEGPYSPYLNCLNELKWGVYGVYLEENGYYGFGAREGGGKLSDDFYLGRDRLDPSGTMSPMGTHVVAKSGGYFIPDPKSDEISWSEPHAGREFPAVGYVQKKVTFEGSDNKKPLYMIYRYSRASKGAAVKLHDYGLQNSPYKKARPVLDGRVLSIGQNDGSKKVIRTAVLQSLKTLLQKFEDVFKNYGRPMWNEEKKKVLASLQGIIDACDKIDDKDVKESLAKSKTVANRYKWVPEPRRSPGPRPPRPGEERDIEPPPRAPAAR